MKKILVTLLLFAVLNSVLIGVQKLAHLPGQRRLDALEVIITAERGRLSAIDANLNKRLEAVQAESAAIDTAAAGIEQIEQAYPSGVPGTIYANYSQRVDSYNDRVSRHNAALAALVADAEVYDRDVDAYSAMIDEAEALQSRVGRIWYIIPIPNLKSLD